MRSASFAEWIVARFTTRERAASVIGDLLEAVPQKGKLWFWLSVTRVFLSLTWRRPLALLAMFFVAISWSRAFRFSVLGGLSVHPASYGLIPLFHYLQLAGIFLSVGWAYMAVRFGFKDFFARYLLAAWAVIAALIFFGTMPPVAIACSLAAGFGIAYSFTSKPRRKGLLAVASAIFLSIVWSFLSLPLFNLMGARITLQEIVQVFTGRGMIYLASAPSVWAILAINLSMLIAAGFIYARIRRMFFENETHDTFQVSAVIS